MELRKRKYYKENFPEYHRLGEFKSKFSYILFMIRHFFKEEDKRYKLSLHYYAICKYNDDQYCPLDRHFLTFIWNKRYCKYSTQESYIEYKDVFRGN